MIGSPVKCDWCERLDVYRNVPTPDTLLNGTYKQYGIQGADGWYTISHFNKDVSDAKHLCSKLCVEAWVTADAS